MFILIGIILYLNVLVIVFVYYLLWKKRKVIGFQLGMNISMAAGGLSGMCSGIILIYQFPLYFVTVTVISTIFGVLVGSMYGGMFDFQTILSGWISGLMAGVMSPMVGAAAGQSEGFIFFVEGIFILLFLVISTSTKYN
ncbi:hypothetical protein [Lottiidibacillus patelloidae]|uniref:hypothetical protein n=1 Tax=Lottiidibacillus patelloidae TaxID=2670334 RepID=UPI001E41FD4E|nr:hypothetical protein [Lottiidibacillus patelloidae]